jgi:hypothetical protein
MLKGEMNPREKKPGEDELENLPAEWEREDEETQGRKPDLGEIEEDPSELLHRFPGGSSNTLEQRPTRASVGDRGLCPQVVDAPLP